VSGGGFFAGRRQAEFFEHRAGGSLRERLRDQGADGGSNMAPLACSTNGNDAMVSNIATSTS
jgi:hypothetical protein